MDFKFQSCRSAPGKTYPSKNERHHQPSSPFTILSPSCPRLLPSTIIMKYRVKSQRLSQMKSQRSPRACSACRCRKVRCDVSSKGAPCTTCRFHDIPCSVPFDRRGEKPSPVTHLPDNPSPPQSDEIRNRHVTTLEGECCCMPQLVSEVALTDHRYPRSKS